MVETILTRGRIHSLLQIAAICFTQKRHLPCIPARMKRETLQQWAKRFVADLRVDGEDVSFDGTIHKHIEIILHFRAKRLKAKTILRAITQAGGRRGDRQPYSEGQFRIAVSRCARKLKGRAGQNVRAQPIQRRRRRSVASQTAKPRPAPQTPRGQRSKPSFSTQEHPSPIPDAMPALDVSPDEIAAALSRINRVK